MPAIPPRRRRQLPPPSSSNHPPTTSSESSNSDVSPRVRLRSLQRKQLPTQLGIRQPQHLTNTAPSSNPIRHLFRRQHVVKLPPLPAEYQGVNAGPAPGTIVGIVLGSVVGFLLLVWLLVVVVNNRANAQYIEGDDTEIVVRRDHHSSRRSRHKSTRQSRSEVSERSHRSSRPAPRPQPSPARNRTERILVQETTRRTESRAPPPRSQPSVVQERESVNINITEREQSRASRRVEGDDMVEVIEEHTDVSAVDPPPERKKSGYRTVDPSQYAGGNYPQEQVYGERSRSRRNR